MVMPQYVSRWWRLELPLTPRVITSRHCITQPSMVMPQYTTLMAAGAAVNAKNNMQCTPLHWGAINGHVSVCTALVAAGAAVDTKDTADVPPLRRAVLRSFLDVARFLLGAGADFANAAEHYRSASYPCTASIRVLFLAGAAHGVVSRPDIPPARKQLLQNKLYGFPSEMIAGMGLERACGTDRAVLACVRNCIHGEREWW